MPRQSARQIRRQHNNQRLFKSLPMPCSEALKLLGEDDNWLVDISAQDNDSHSLSDNDNSSIISDTSGAQSVASSSSSEYSFDGYTEWDDEFGSYTEAVYRKPDGTTRCEIVDQVSKWSR